MRRRALLVLVGAFAGGVAAGYRLKLRPLWRSWGVDRVEAGTPLAGDELVSEATASDTRGLDIDAAPADVWPWLAQMGYNRAGWYSYDAMDMKGASLWRVDPDLQYIAVGDLVPTSPETSFVARVVDPPEALAQYVDDAIVQEQATAARARKLSGQAVEATPTNLKVAGWMSPSMRGFAASWAFALRPIDDGRRTRLIERVRVRMPAPQGPAARMLGGAFGLGVFLMTRRQMLGIRARAERPGAI
jgi:hypothetical protein